MENRILVKDRRSVVASELPREVRVAMSDLEPEKLDRFYRAVRVWYDPREKRFDFEDRA